MSAIPQISVFERFPNRYTGGYLGSTVTEKLKYKTIAEVRASNKGQQNGGSINRLNSFSDQGMLSGPAIVASSGICYPAYSPS